MTNEAILQELGELFEEAGYRLYLVGGSVRDFFLGRSNADLDFTTGARPEAIWRILKPWADDLWDTGIEYGTVFAGKGGQRVEITTFRADSYDQVSRNPQVRFGSSLAEDLKRRDFTVNAMARPVTKDGLGDLLPCQGRTDLIAGLLDTPAAPEVSFGDDPLRMLRAARFVAQLGLSVATRVRDAIEEMAPQLARITAERKAAELDKLLLGKRADSGLKLLIATGMGDILLPGVQIAPIASAIALEDEPDLTLRWAALLRDTDPEAARLRLRELKYSNALINGVHRLLVLRAEFLTRGQISDWVDPVIRRWIAKAGPDMDQAHRLIRADCSKRMADNVLYVSDSAACMGRDFLTPVLDGFEIKALLDIPAGPRVGKAMHYLQELQMERGAMSCAYARAALMEWDAAEEWTNA